jgi:hypothetical protein
VIHPTGEDAFTLHNVALFIDDYLGAYPNGICLSSFVSCPTYYGFWRTGYWCAQKPRTNP